MSQPQPDSASLDKQADHLIALVTTLNAAVEESNQSIAESNVAIAMSDERIDELSYASHRSKRMIRLLIASVAFDMLLSVILAIATWQAFHAGSTADKAIAKNRELVAEACLANNEIRELQLTLWSRKLSKDLEIATDPAEKAVAQDMLVFVVETFVPRPCSDEF